MADASFEKVKNICRSFVLFAAAAAAVLLVFPYLFRLFLPFVIGGLLALIAKPLFLFFGRLRLPRFAAALLALIIVFLIFALSVRVIFAGVVKELLSFADSFSDIYKASAEAAESIAGRIGTLTKRSALSHSALRALTDKLGDSLRSRIAEAVNSLTAFLIVCAKNVPNILLISFISFFSAFFFLKDRKLISAFFYHVLGARVYGALSRAKKAAFGAAGCYVKAQLIIGALIFAILLIGFVILRVKYALLFAFITAVVDAVPVLGTGTVLIPWAAFSVFSDNPSLGWGLLSLYGVCLLTRQLSEPKIIGVKLGLHPLATIFSIYAGMRLFGILGLIIGPVLALMIKNVVFSQ